jgi:nitrogen regulatory protein PII
MKAVLIVHNMAIDEEVNEALVAAGIESFTKFPNTLGKGKLSEPHLNSEVWPETNCCTLVITDPDKAATLMDIVREMRTRLGTEGVKAFAWTVDETT